MAEDIGQTKAGARAHQANAGSIAPIIVKKEKTRGRKKSSIEEQLERGKVASQIAPWHDDTTISAELAAIYLGMSLKQLADLRSKPKPSDEPRGVEGPLMVKIVDKGSVGQNQPVNYKLGDLRQYQAKNKSTTSFGAALNAGLLGWTTMQVPFFAKLEKREDRGRKVLHGNAWDASDPRREERFKELVEDKTRIVWLTPMEAAASRWDDLSKHKAFAKIGLALMKGEAMAVKAAIEGTEISTGVAESKTKAVPSRRRP